MVVLVLVCVCVCVCAGGRGAEGLAHAESRNFRWGVMTTVAECHRGVGAGKKQQQKGHVLCVWSLVHQNDNC